MLKYKKFIAKGIMQMKKKNSTFVIILVVSLIVVGIGLGMVVVGGSIFAYQYFKEEPATPVNKQEEKEEENQFEIVIEWDGKYPNDNSLIDLEVIFSGTLKDGTKIALDAEDNLAYDSDGKLVATVKKVIVNNKGTITIHLYDSNGTFALEAYDGRFNPQMWDNEISVSNGKAIVTKNEKEEKELEALSGLRRSNAGYDFWGICGIKDGELTAYNGSWATTEWQVSGGGGEISLGLSLSEADIDARVTRIREVYYGIQNNISAYKKEDGGSGTVRYLKDGLICKIEVKAGTYVDQGYDSKYKAQYYYDNEQLAFVFVYSGNEEHRFYMDATNGWKVVRYIDSSGVTHNYTEGAEATEISSVGYFCNFAMQEIAWAKH